MEAKLVLILAACILLSFISNKGHAQPCAPSDLLVNHTTMPGKVGGRPHYLVTVENRCVCTQLGVKLACAGLNSTVSVDPAGVVVPTGDDGALCTLNGGQPMHANETVLFVYASSMEISFRPVSSFLDCSIAPSPAPQAAP
ncbi:uncharacterized protein [Aegilops tauschii subsp. strangulata]|uniref:uncharacterized protein n=1 Tax=Aegilops tauschii subsp. strangulata TaxID=200361 RepID=UPI001ABD082E|nr:uncharacterized protein LOC120968292 [Aegilops tauschii subsp. strangulata]